MNSEVQGAPGRGLGWEGPGGTPGRARAPASDLAAPQRPRPHALQPQRPSRLGVWGAICNADQGRRGSADPPRRPSSVSSGGAQEAEWSRWR